MLAPKHLLRSQGGLFTVYSVSPQWRLLRLQRNGKPSGMPKRTVCSLVQRSHTAQQCFVLLHTVSAVLCQKLHFQGNLLHCCISHLPETLSKEKQMAAVCPYFAVSLHAHGSVKCNCFIFGLLVPKFGKHSNIRGWRVERFEALMFQTCLAWWFGRHSLGGLLLRVAPPPVTTPSAPPCISRWPAAVRMAARSHSSCRESISPWTPPAPWGSRYHSARTRWGWTSCLHVRLISHFCFGWLVLLCSLKHFVTNCLQQLQFERMIVRDEFHESHGCQHWLFVNCLFWWW